VILDEATARLDPVTEARVQQATERLLRNRIGIVIAHRRSSVRHCDEVVVLADGEVVEAVPLQESHPFAPRLARTQGAEPAGGGGGAAAVELPTVADPVEPPAVELRVAPKADPPPLPQAPRARTLREIVRLTTNDPRYGIAAVALFVILVVFGLDGAVLP